MSEQLNVSQANESEQPQKSKTSRRTLLRNAAIGATTVATTAATASLFLTQTANAASASVDPLRLRAGTAFEEIKRDEDAHVNFLKQALGSYARPKPTFKHLIQNDVEHFIKLAQVFENVGVGAYLLAAPAISSKGYLAAAGSILTIEARHAGYLNALVGLQLSTNGSFDKPIPQATIVADVAPFIASLNGGSDPSKPLANDIDILNFALLLEFLEASFYDLNVERFY